MFFLNLQVNIPVLTIKGLGVKLLQIINFTISNFHNT